eukprot:932875-Amphidinium_carterae.2
MRKNTSIAFLVAAALLTSMHDQVPSPITLILCVRLLRHEEGLALVAIGSPIPTSRRETPLNTSSAKSVLCSADTVLGNSAEFSWKGLRH